MARTSGYLHVLFYMCDMEPKLTIQNKIILIYIATRNDLRANQMMFLDVA